MIFTANIICIQTTVIEQPHIDHNKPEKKEKEIDDQQLIEETEGTIKDAKRVTGDEDQKALDMADSVTNTGPGLDLSNSAVSKAIADRNDCEQAEREAQKDRAFNRSMEEAINMNVPAPTLSRSVPYDHTNVLNTNTSEIANRLLRWRDQPTSLFTNDSMWSQPAALPLDGQSISQGIGEMDDRFKNSEHQNQSEIVLGEFFY